MRKKEYITPECEVLAASAEGMLCGSMTATASVEDWQSEDMAW